MLSFFFDMLITAIRTIFKKARLAGILLLLLIVEIFVVVWIENDQLQDLSMRPDLKLVSARVLDYTPAGQVRLRVQIKNQGSRSNNYPYLEIDGDNGTVYLQLDPTMQPLESTSVSGIPGGESVSAVYLLNEYDAADIKGETVTLRISEYDCIQPSERKIRF